MTNVKYHARVVELDAECVECLHGREGVHDLLGKGTMAQDMEVRSLSDDVTDFARVIAVREMGEERGKGSLIQKFKF